MKLKFKVGDKVRIVAYLKESGEPQERPREIDEAIKKGEIFLIKDVDVNITGYPFKLESREANIWETSFSPKELEMAFINWRNILER